MDSRSPPHSPGRRAVCGIVRKLGLIVAALYIAVLVLTHDGELNNSMFSNHSARLMKSLPGHTQLPKKQTTKMSRKLHEEENSVDNSLKLRLVHKNLVYPSSTQFPSIEDEIMHHTQMDVARIQGFSASLRYAAYQHQTRDIIVPSPSTSSHDAIPPPSPSFVPEEFLGRVTSGAFLPSHSGLYFVEFAIGTPPQSFLFIADSGSDLVWAPCSHCKDCTSHTSSSSSATFFSENSSTFKSISCSSQECDLVPPPPKSTCSGRPSTSCTYAYAYSDLTQTSGIFAYETVTMMSTNGKSVHIKNVAFGCGTNNTGNSVTQVGGVIGLGQGPISFPSQVGYLFGNKFSYCFTRFFRTRASSSLVFGDNPTGRELKSTIQYTPIVPNLVFDTFYYVGIEAVSIDRKVLPINPSVWVIDRHGNGGAIIDSGTTLTFFLPPAYDAIVKAFKAAITYPIAPPTAGLDLCYNVSGVAHPVLPKFSITFKGTAVFRPPSNNYFLTPTDDLRCLSFMASLSAASAGMTVLGNLMQQSYYVEYDRFNNRIGFARAQCSTHQ